ncbi:UNVERIFIED_ORG: 2-oxoglutarate-Fe(II)-dependent oxygenase superfamily protein [Actinomadura viridilutea]
MPGGGVMSVQTVCLRWHWEPYRYVRHVDGEPAKPFPDWLADLRRRAVTDAYGDHGGYRPDVALRPVRRGTPGRARRGSYPTMHANTT